MSDKEVGDASYWKSEAERWKSLYTESQENLKEFQESSRELETELERELATLEGKNKDLIVKNERLLVELEEYREKTSYLRSEKDKIMVESQKLLETERSNLLLFKERARELELDNDDLQNMERVKSCSLEDLESKYNKMMERNALLESEIEEKESLIVEIQRLRDELNEMTDELAVAKSGNENRTPVKNRNTILLSQSALGNTASPSQMVHDITQRVKNLESRLSSCRKMIAPLLEDQK